MIGPAIKPSYQVVSLTSLHHPCVQLEELLQEYKNVCILRVRMPITSDLTNPRNFITKISRYQKVWDASVGLVGLGLAHSWVDTGLKSTST